MKRRVLGAPLGAIIAPCADPTLALPRALDAVALARDPTRLQQATAAALVTAAAVLAKNLVTVIEGTGHRAQRASALDVLDAAGRAIGKELRGRA
jgi:hypothetical protein